MVHTIDIIIPEHVHTELLDVLDYTENETAHPVQKFIYESLAFARKAKKELKILGKVPYQTVDGKGNLIDKQISVDSIGKAPKGKAVWKPDFDDPTTIRYNVGDRTHDALMFFAAVTEFRFDNLRKLPNQPGMSRPKYVNAQKLFSDLVLDSARVKIVEAEEKDQEKEFDEIYSNEPKQKPAPKRRGSRK